MVKRTLQNILKRELKKRTIILYNKVLYFVQDNQLIVICEYLRNNEFIMTLECAEGILLHLNISPTKYQNAYHITHKAFINRIFPISNIKNVAGENILYRISGVPDIYLTQFGYDRYDQRWQCYARTSLCLLSKDTYINSIPRPCVIPTTQVHLCHFIVDYYLSYFCQDLRRIIIQYSEYDILN